MIIKANSKSKFRKEKLLPLWGGKEIDLALTEKLRLEVTTDLDVSKILNEAGKITNIYSKPIRNY